MKFSRRSALTALTALLLAACGESSAPSGPVIDDTGELGHAKGSDSAPVTIIEYASPTCGTCAYFHEEIRPTLMEEYVDTGKVQFVFREYALHGPDTPIYAFAYCAGEDKFLDIVDDLFANQNGVIDAAQNGVLLVALQTIGARHGIESQAQIEACISNRDITNRIADTHATGEAYNIPGTPAFVINGEMIPWTRLNSMDKFRDVLDPMLTDFVPAETAPSAPVDADEAPATEAVDAPAPDASGDASGSQD